MVLSDTRTTELSLQRTSDWLPPLNYAYKFCPCSDHINQLPCPGQWAITQSRHVMFQQVCQHHVPGKNWTDKRLQNLACSSVIVCHGPFLCLCLGILLPGSPS